MTWPLPLNLTSFATTLPLLSCLCTLLPESFRVLSDVSWAEKSSLTALNKITHPTGYINRIVSQCFRSMKFSSRIYYALNRNALRKHDCGTHRGLATGVGQLTRTALTGTITLQPYALGSCAKLPRSTSWLFLNLNLWSGTTCHTKWVFPAYATIDWWNKYSRPHPGQARRLRPFYIIFWCIMNRNVNSKIFHQLEKNSTHVSFG